LLQSVCFLHPIKEATSGRMPIFGSEETPLIASAEAKNTRQQEQEEDRTTITTTNPFLPNDCKGSSYNNNGSLVQQRDGGVTTTVCTIGYHRRRAMMLLAIATTIVLVSASVAILGVSDNNAVQLSSPSIGAISGDLMRGSNSNSNTKEQQQEEQQQTERTTTNNASNLKALGESLGSSLEGLPNASVASDHPLCSKIGTSILQQKGGNAVDAAIATALCLGVANPASSGLGGGAFLLVRSSSSHFQARQQQPSPPLVFDDARDPSATDPSDELFVTEAIDCREAAPGNSSKYMYSGLPYTASLFGGLAISVPGELRCLELAHARHGKISWQEVVEPALVLARDGVVVSPHLGGFIEGFFLHFFTKLPPNKFEKLKNYLSGGGESYLREGEIMKNPPLARTLQAVAENGADAYYIGPIAEQLVQDVRAAGGTLTTSDMESYRAVLRTPVFANVSTDYTLVGVPPPSSGGAVVIAIARFLSGYSNNINNRTWAASAETLGAHRMVEGMRHAFAIRMSLSDPLFGASVNKEAVRDLTQTGYMESLRRITKDDTVLPLSSYGGPKWAQLNDGDGTKEAVDAQEGDRRRRRLVRKQESPLSHSALDNNDDDRHPQEDASSDPNTNNNSKKHAGNDRRRLSRPFGYLDDSGTTHLSVVDKDGNAVALTTSINGVFGSLVYSESTGVILGNTMDDFGVPIEGSNAFGLRPSAANFIVPGKRPLSSMSPTIVLRKRNRDSSSGNNNWGDLVMVLGGSGGPKIISSVIQVILNVLFLGMPIFDAVTKPRIHDQLLYHDSIVTNVEKSTLGGKDGPTLEVAELTKDALRQRHHKVLDIDYTGCVQAILVNHETNTLSAVSDMRKGGSPSGY